jgi:hypothetical protein
MTTLTEGRHTGEAILSEAQGHYCREQITILSGEGKLSANQVLGKTLATASAAVTAKSGNTGGSGTLTMDGTTPILGNFNPGRYSVFCIEPGTNAGVFAVINPNGIIIGTAVAGGSAFANEIKFTISDATDFVAGDGFWVDVSAATYKYRSADPTNTDGSGVACAVLLAAVDATSADAPGVAFTRGPSEMNGNCLVYDANVDDATKKALKKAELAAAGIIVR